MLAVERQVVLRGASAQGEGMRRGGKRALDNLARDLGDRGLAIDRRAVCLEHVEGFLGVEHDADVLDDVERGLVDLPDLVGGEKLELDALADVTTVCVGHGVLPFGKTQEETACAGAVRRAGKQRRRERG